MRHFRWMAAAGLVASSTVASCTTTVTTFEDDGGGASSSSSNGSGASSSTSSSSTSSSTSSGGTNFGACTRSDECIVSVPGCCGPCGEPTLADVEPINASQASAFYDATCNEDEPLCPDCVEGVNPYLYAFCDAGQCTEAETLSQSWNTCERDPDCTLRVGTNCCEDCTLGDPTNLVAVPIAGGGLTSQVCDGQPVPCPPCAPTYPSEASAACVYGACQVVWNL